MGVIVVVVVALLVVSLIVKMLFGWAFGLAFAAIIWGVIGYFAGRVIRGEGYGLVGNVVLGLIGGIVGSISLNVIGLGGITDIAFIGQLISGVVGAVIVITLVRVFVDKEFGA